MELLKQPDQLSKLYTFITLQRCNGLQVNKMDNNHLWMDEFTRHFLKAEMQNQVNVNGLMLKIGIDYIGNSAIED